MSSKRVVLTGASGLVGGRLVPYLDSCGYDVVKLVRRPVKTPVERHWNPAEGVIEPGVLEGAAAVINLSGVSIAGKRWNDARKREILQSRIDATSFLARTVAESRHKPDVFISTSAVGYYGDGGITVLTEDSPRGDGFLADVCQAWEDAAAPAREAGVRVVHPRLGSVLAGEGGMLPQLKRLFGFGIGGRLGGGDQFMSWIDSDDLVRAFEFLITHPAMKGPVNAVSPISVTNRTFTHTLGTSLHRPTMIPAPAFALHAVMGQMADELLLISQRVVPMQLIEHGFVFESSYLDRSLQRQLSGPGVLTPGIAKAHAA